jgi:hypothetical protein
LKEYLAVSGALDFYRNHTLNITNSHPFAKLALNNTSGGARSETSLFPAIVVATESDDKTAALAPLADVFGITLTLEDVSPLRVTGRAR